MNPYRLLAYAKRILSVPKVECDPHIRWCAGMVRFNIVSMTIVTISTVIAFIGLGWGSIGLWEKAFAWNQSGVPIFWNLPAHIMLLPGIMFLLAVTLLFSQHDTHHGRMVQLANGIKPAK